MTELAVQHNYRGHLWCGIGALSAALRIPTSMAKDIIKNVSLRKYIKAVTYSEMAHALSSMGVATFRDYFPRNASDCPTLNNWLEGNFRKWNRVYIVCITGHWIVIKNDQWVDSMNQTARDISSCPYLRAKVRHVVSFDWS